MNQQVPELRDNPVLLLNLKSCFKMSCNRYLYFPSWYSQCLNLNLRRFIFLCECTRIEFAQSLCRFTPVLVFAYFILSHLVFMMNVNDQYLNNVYTNDFMQLLILQMRWKSISSIQKCYIFIDPIFLRPWPKLTDASIFRHFVYISKVNLHLSPKLICCVRQCI